MSSRTRISLLLAATLIASLLAILIVTFNSGKTNAQTQAERELEDKIPKHVPIKIKIRADKEKAFKDLSNAHWNRNFELEVTNTSDKPIYFLELWLVLPEVLSENNRQVGVPLRYGRMDFIHFSTVATSSDAPIPPGGAYIFKIPEEDQSGWDLHKARDHRPDPKKIQIKFVQLSFGDGTGFNGTDAKPYPYKRERSANGPCREDPGQIVPKGGGTDTSFILLPLPLSFMAGFFPKTDGTSAVIFLPSRLVIRF